MKIIDLMPWADWLALLSLFGLWAGYALFASRRGQHNRSLLATSSAPAPSATDCAMRWV